MNLTLSLLEMKSFEDVIVKFDPKGGLLKHFLGVWRGRNMGDKSPLNSFTIEGQVQFFRIGSTIVMKYRAKDLESELGVTITKKGVR